MEAMDIVAIASLVAAVLAYAGLRVMRSQLRSAHGRDRTIRLEAVPSTLVAGSPDTASVREYEVQASVAGNGLVRELRVWIKGVPEEARKTFDNAVVPSMTAEDPPLSVKFSLPADYDLSEVRWGLRWTEPALSTLASQLVAAELPGPDDDGIPRMWRWKWRRLGWASHAYYRALGTAPGRWVRIRQRDLEFRQDPRHRVP